MLNYQQFMARLQQASDLQQQSLAQREQESENARRQLLSADIRIASLNKLLDRHRLAGGHRTGRCQEAERHVAIVALFSVLVCAAMRAPPSTRSARASATYLR